MTEITSKLPYAAGYNVKLAFVIQDLKNLDEIYGESTPHPLLWNCGFQLVLGANDSATAENVSEALGKITMTYWTEPRSVQIIGLNNRSCSQQKLERDLLMPKEVVQLPADDMIPLAEGQLPFVARRCDAFRKSRSRPCPIILKPGQHRRFRPKRIGPQSGAAGMAVQTDILQSGSRAGLPAPQTG